MPHNFSRRSFVRSSALAAASTLLAVACSRQTNSSLSTSESSQPIRLGLNLWPGAIPWQIAEEQGFFEAASVNAEIIWFQTLGDQINAFNASKIDIA